MDIFLNCKRNIILSKGISDFIQNINLPDGRVKLNNTVILYKKAYNICIIIKNNIYLQQSKLLIMDMNSQNYSNQTARILTQFVSGIVFLIALGVLFFIIKMAIGYF